MWIPHQVAVEFQRNRVSIIRTQRAVPDQYIKSLNDLANQIDGLFKQHERNSLIEIEPDRSDLVNHVKAIQERAVSEKSDRLQDYGITPQSDGILERLGSLYEGRVGEAPSADELSTLYGLAKDRYALEIPPGYRDSQKPEPGRYGDFVIWRQVIDYAKQNSVDVLFVTGDTKEDWWWINSGQTLGPRPELRDEFRTASNGRSYYSFRPDQLFRELKIRGIASTADSVVAEVFRTPEIPEQTYRLTTLLSQPLIYQRDPARHLNEFLQKALSVEPADLGPFLHELETQLAIIDQACYILGNESQDRHMRLGAAQDEVHDSSVDGESMRTALQADVAVVDARMELMQYLRANIIEARSRLSDRLNSLS